MSINEQYSEEGIFLKEKRASGTSIVHINSFLSFTLVSLIVFSALFYRSNIIGVLIAGLSVFFVGSPDMLLPAVWISSLLDETAFVFGNITAARFFTLEIIVFVILNDKNSIRKNKKINIIYFLFAVYIFFSSLFSMDGFSMNAVTMLLNILFVVIMSRMKFVDLKRMTGVFVGTAFELVCGLLFKVYARLYTLSSNGSYKLLDNTNNNNISITMAQVAALFIAVLVFELNQNKNVKRIILYIFGYISSIYLIILLGSRGAFFAVCFATFVAVIYYLKLKNVKLSAILIVPVFLVLLYFVLRRIIDSNVVFASRFSIDEIENSGGTGRFEIWKLTWDEIIIKNPIFGAGYNGLSMINILTSLGKGHGIHNMVLDILAQLGIVGLSFISLFIVYSIKSVMKIFSSSNDRFTLILIVLIFALIANGFSENIYQRRCLWIYFGISAYFASLRTESLENDSK